MSLWGITQWPWLWNQWHISSPIHHEIIRRKTNVQFRIIYHSQIPTRLTGPCSTDLPFKTTDSCELIITLKCATVDKPGGGWRFEYCSYLLCRFIITNHSLNDRSNKNITLIYWGEHSPIPAPKPCMFGLVRSETERHVHPEYEIFIFNIRKYFDYESTSGINYSLLTLANYFHEISYH